MSYFPASVSPVEASIINRVICAVQAAGLTVTISDNNGLALSRSSNRKAIQISTGATTETLYVFFDMAGECVGAVEFNHGGNADVIGACSGHGELEWILCDAITYARTLA